MTQSNHLVLAALVEPMCAFLGEKGLAYFRGVSDAGGPSLAAAGSFINGNYLMVVRNKMRELLGYPDESKLPQHFYDDNCGPLIHMCLNRSAKKNCDICGGTGYFRPLPDGFDPLPIQPCPHPSGGTDD